MMPVAALLGLAACGGGGATPPGGALAAAPTGSTGVVQITLAGHALPCAVEVSGGAVNGVANPLRYHFIATAEGAVNITPFTDLIVANLAGTATPDDWFAGLGANPAQLAAFTQAEVDAALGRLRAALSGLTALGDIDPVTTGFTPAPGDVSDDMLAALAQAMEDTGTPYAALLINASIPAFGTPGAGFNAALASTYPIAGCSICSVRCSGDG